MTAYRRRWYPREHTKHGGVLPPVRRNRVGSSSSSAIRRHQARIDEKRILNDYVQLAPGVLVVWDRQPWRVIEVNERPADLWGPKYEEAFEDAVAGWDRWPHGDRPEKTTWHGRPFAVVIVPDGKPAEKPLHLIGPAHHRWDVLPEHYAVCSQCGELPPCRHEEAEQEADLAVAHAEVLMDIPAGHCLGCGEHITSRQKAERFPGPNLWRPDLGDNTAVFHTRQECSEPRDRYRKQFAEVGGEQQQMALDLDDPTP